MSNYTNDELISQAVELSDVMDERFEDPSYSDRVSAILNSKVPDLEELYSVVNEMHTKIWHSDIDDLPECIIW